MLPENFKYVHHLPPSIVNLGSKNYTCDKNGWSEVLESTTLEEINNVWERILFQPEQMERPERSWIVPSSDNKRSYTVTHKNGYFSCECVGFGYRHKCKHVDYIKGLTIATNI
jgi:hypothetical protein